MLISNTLQGINIVSNFFLQLLYSLHLLSNICFFSLIKTLASSTNKIGLRCERKQLYTQVTNERFSFYNSFLISIELAGIQVSQREKIKSRVLQNILILPWY